MEKFKTISSKVIESLKHFFSATGKIIIFLAAMAVGYFAGEIHSHYQEKEARNEIKLPPVKTLEDVLVSFSLGGEVIFINKETGYSEIYSDSIVMMIFNNEAMKMYYKTQK